MVNQINKLLINNQLLKKKKKKLLNFKSLKKDIVIYAINQNNYMNVKIVKSIYVKIVTNH